MPAELYFAYGPELDKQTMKEAVPTARLRAKGTLSGYRFDFPVRSESGTGLAGIVADEGGQAEGVVYTVTREDMAALDKVKGPNAAFKRSRVQVVLAGGGLVRAWTHVAVPQEGYPFAPAPEYLDALIQAVTEHGLSAGLLGRLQSRRPTPRGNPHSM